MHTFAHLDQTRHGTAEFPVEYYYVDHKHPRYQMPFHWHQEWEILRVLDGNFSIHLDGKEYCVGSGDILLIRGGMLHGGVPNDCTYECFVFDLYGLFRGTDMLKRYLRPFYRQTQLPQSYFPAGTDEPVHAVVQELMSVFREGQDYPELDTVACLCKLFSWLLKNGRHSENPEVADPGIHRIDLIKTVMEYIEANFNTELSLEKLAQVVGMNPKYFCRMFSRLTHQSPMEYVNLYRIEQAAYLLSSTNLPVGTVAMECGFWESSYFTKVFKKYKGTTPRCYRQSANQ